MKQGGQIYVQSSLKFLRAGRPEVWGKPIAGHIFSGHLSEQTFTFAPQHLFAGDLMKISQNYLESSSLYDSPDEHAHVTPLNPFQGRCVGCGYEELAYHVLGRTGPWLEVQTDRLQHGYIGPTSKWGIGD